MIFSNYKNIAVSPGRKKLLKLVETAIKMVHPKQLIPRVVSYKDEKLYINSKKFSTARKRIFVIGAGKASAEMALEIEKILGANRITDGVVITNNSKIKLKKIKVHIADHPIPSERGLSGAKKIFSLKEKYKINKNDIVIALVSGGGSALMPYPIPGISLKDKKKLYDLFIKYAVTGRESSVIKTKISRVKGGGVAKHFYPSQIISLIISDDNGHAGDLSTASGPFTEHASTFKEAIEVINLHKMRKEVPKTIMAYLEKNKNKITKKINFNHVNQFVIINNCGLVNNLKNLSKKNNLETIVKCGVEGEAKDAAYKFCCHIKKISKKKKAIILIYGGETTVTLSKKNGLGGRNQEFTTACLKYLSNSENDFQWTVASIASDGIDFIKISAGGIIDKNSIDMLKEKKINLDNYLENHNTYKLLSLINSNIKSAGPTGTNVGDIMLCLLNKKKI